MGLFLDVFILWIVKIIRNEIRTRRAIKWPIAIGKVVRGRIVEDGFNKYRPVADYSFDVSGESFYGQANGYRQNNERAADLVDRILPGASLRIRYDAVSPANNMVFNRDNPDFSVAFEEFS